MNFNNAFRVVVLMAVCSFSFAQTPKQQPPIKESIDQVKEDFNSLKNLFKKKDKKGKENKEVEQDAGKAKKMSEFNILTIDESIVRQIVEKIQKDNIGEKIEITEEGESVTVSVQFDWGSTFTIFSKMKDKHVFGDLKNDGNEDAIIQASAYYGGNSEHLILYIFSKTGNDWKLVFEINASEEQLKGCGIGKFIPEKIENGFLIGESRCFKDSDPRCCPSLKYRTLAKLENEQLVLVKKEKKQRD